METSSRNRQPIVNGLPDRGCHPQLRSCVNCPLAMCRFDFRKKGGISALALAIAATWRKGIYPTGMREVYKSETRHYWDDIPRKAR